MPRVTGRHHVLGVEHLLGELGHRQVPVPLGSARCERSEARHEEVQSREGHHVDGQLAEVGVQLARKPQAGGDAGHGGGHQVVQIAVGRGGQAQRVEADVVEGLVVDDVGLVSVLHQQVYGKRAVVRLHHCVRHLQGSRVFSVIF